MKLRNLTYINIIIGIVLAGFLAGCKEDVSEPYTDKASDPVLFSAKVKDILVSRADNPIKDHDLNIIFQNSAGYEFGIISFNSQGLGTSIRYDGGKETDLIWEYLGFEYDKDDKDKKYPLYSFYVDNIPESLNTGSTFVEFPENIEENPYRADFYRSYENQNDNNDLIWGSIEKVVKAPSLTLSLSHVMSRVELWVYFDNNISSEARAPKSAVITNIFKAPKGFDRLTGEWTLPETLPENSEFVLANDDESSEFKWERKEEKVIEGDEIKTITYYVSPDFVVPPQQFISNQRPRLTVTLANDQGGNGQVFTGLFPLAMNLLDEDGNPTPWVMSFIRGYKIILKVKIGNEPSTLEFMPSTVLEWESKGTKNISGLQASIAREEDLQKLIEAYNNGDSRYFDHWGYYDENSRKWYFNIFLSLDVSSSYKESMPENSDMPYEFNLNSGIVYLNVDNNTTLILSGTEGAKILKDFISNGIVPDPLPENPDPSNPDPENQNPED